MRSNVGAEAPTYKDKDKKKQVPHFVRDDSLSGGPQGLKPVFVAWCGTTGSRALPNGESGRQTCFPAPGRECRSLGRTVLGAGLSFVLQRVIGIGGDVDVAGGLELAGFLVEVYGVGVHDHGASVANGDAFFV